MDSGTTSMSGLVQPIVTVVVGLVAGIVFVIGTYKSVTGGVEQRLKKEQQAREERKLVRRQGAA
jgi:hypothetical protein